MEGDLSGQRIGEYEVVAPLGRGGMGMVYEGRQPLIGKRVAIKVLLRELSGRDEVVERFLAEARAVNAIRHRGIVDIFSFGQLPDGTHYCVMEFLEGAPFDRLIRTRAPVPPGDALRWTDEVLDALEAAHRAGVIHRDIKPSNLFLVDTGSGRPYVKLLDFGIAKLATALDTLPRGEASEVVGTPDYMAPEQARAKEITGATDLYALGCVLFELLTRERVFEGLTAIDMMFAHVQREPRAPSTVVQSLPREIDDLVLRFLAKRPEDRPRSALAAREEIHLLLRKLNEAPSLLPPSAFTTRVPRVDTDGEGIPSSATPRPGWNEDDEGKGATWMSGGASSPDARTELAAALPPVDAGTIAPRRPERRPRRALWAAAGLTAAASASAAGLWLYAGSGEEPHLGPNDTWARSRDAGAAAPPPALPDPGVAAPLADPSFDAGAVPDAATAGDAGLASASPSPAPDTPVLRPGARPSAPTARALAQRVKKLERQLEALEAQKGEQRVLRKLLGSVAASVAAARSPAELRAAAKELDELQGQFRQ